MSTIEKKRKRINELQKELLREMQRFIRMTKIMTFMSQRKKHWTTEHMFHTTGVMLGQMIRVVSIRNEIRTTQSQPVRKFQKGGVHFKGTGEGLEEWMQEQIIQPRKKS